MDLSIVIPLLNEEDSLGELTEWISRVCTGMDITYEILFIDDGSTDGSWNKIMTLKNEYPTVKGYKFRRNYGKSAALNTGFEKCSGGIVITMDADLQDNPDEIPALFNMIKYDGFDLVSGWKRKRQDPMGKRIPSKFFNWVTRRLSGIQ
ncbi:MAG: glycosyltransferase family 2 protein, partial [Saprospiraceae bacterium]